jgi:hypothetical protein
VRRLVAAAGPIASPEAAVGTPIVAAPDKT